MALREASSVPRLDQDHLIKAFLVYYIWDIRLVCIACTLVNSMKVGPKFVIRCVQGMPSAWPVGELGDKMEEGVKR
jgi:hypothetical protein